MKKIIGGFLAGVAIIPLYNFLDSLLEATSGLIINKIGAGAVKYSVQIQKAQDELEPQKTFAIGFKAPDKEEIENEEEEE